MQIEHHFETTTGDELTVDDLMNATYRIVETMVDIDEPGRGRPPVTVFTHRIELHSTDDQIIAGMRPHHGTLHQGAWITDIDKKG
jgi:hypothetical protein